MGFNLGFNVSIRKKSWAQNEQNLNSKNGLSGLMMYVCMYESSLKMESQRGEFATADNLTPGDSRRVKKNCGV